VKDELYKDQHNSGVGYPLDDTLSRLEQASIFSKEESRKGAKDVAFKVDLNEMRRGSEMVMRAKLVQVHGKESNPDSIHYRSKSTLH